jgi:hypothetical protein
MSGEQRPLTDEELAAIEMEFTGRRDAASAFGILLVHEVRRLRSDEWLERATKEIDPYQGGQRLVLAILRRHRDGKA